MFFRILSNSFVILKCLRLFLAITNYQLFVDSHNLRGMSQSLSQNLLLALISYINRDCFFHIVMKCDCILPLPVKCLEGSKSKLNDKTRNKQPFHKSYPITVKDAGREIFSMKFNVAMLLRIIYHDFTSTQLWSCDSKSDRSI